MKLDCKGNLSVVSTTDRREESIAWQEAVYTGELKMGKPHGKGTLAFPCGTKYVGNWKNGKKQGQGH